MNGISFANQVSFILVFFEGMLSFLSPCVIPLLPVYMSYLAGSAKSELGGTIVYPRKRVLIHTVFFILGISVAFLLLGASFTMLGKLISGNKYIFIRISGILIIIMGLFQLGVFRLSFLHKERKLHYNITDKKVNPLIAFVLGFTFSFAWTPCIGPALSSVLILASGAKTAVTGYLLIFVYSIGFTIPFLLLGLFTTQVLNFFQRKKKWIQYTIKIGGILLIIIGIMTFTGFMNGISGYINKATGNSNSTTEGNQSENIKAQSSVTEEEESASKEAKNKVSAYDFTLMDQYGNVHTLSDYKGKVVFLNFYATWCPPCNKELPDIEKLYQEYGLNKDEVVFLGVTNPKSKDYPNNSDEDVDYIKSFLVEKNYTFPTLFDETGEILQTYEISAFPTTFLIDKDGNVIGYVPGMMTEDIMRSVISQALEANH